MASPLRKKATLTNKHTLNLLIACGSSTTFTVEAVSHENGVVLCTESVIQPRPLPLVIVLLTSSLKQLKVISYLGSDSTAALFLVALPLPWCRVRLHTMHHAGAKAYEKAEDPIFVLEHDIPIDTQSVTALHYCFILSCVPTLTEWWCGAVF